MRFEWNSDNGGSVVVTRLIMGNVCVTVNSALTAEFIEEATDIAGPRQDVFTAIVGQSFKSADVHLHMNVCLKRLESDDMMQSPGDGNYVNIEIQHCFNCLSWINYYQNYRKHIRRDSKINSSSKANGCDHLLTIVYNSHLL